MGDGTKVSKSEIVEDDSKSEMRKIQLLNIMYWRVNHHAKGTIVIIYYIKKAEQKRLRYYSLRNLLFFIYNLNMKCITFALLLPY